MNMFYVKLVRRMPSFPYKLITFDVTGTLLKPKAVFKTYADFAKRCDISVEPTALSGGFRSAYKRMDVDHPNFGLESGLGWRAWWMTVVRDTFKSAVSPESFPDMAGRIDSVAEDLIEHYAKGSAWSTEPQSVEALKRLKCTGACLGVISNFDPRLHRILRENNLSQFFNFVLTSYEAKCAKPSVEIFQRAGEIFERLSSERFVGVEALHVGDDYDLDYVAATNAGWCSILLNRHAEVKCADCVVLPTGEMDPTTLGYTVAKVPRREPSFSITERETLCDLVQAHWAVLENKKTDQQSVSEKTARWKLLAEEFNATSCQFRHWQKLKTLWENMKKRAKSALADDLDNQYVTDPEPRDVALEAVAKAMSRLEFVLGNRPTESTTEQIPRSVLMEVDPWDPDDVEAVAIGTYLEIFDGITRDLADNLRIQLLRIKLRGSAKTFLLDNGHLLEGKECYPALRRALVRWYGRDDPEKAAEQLWTMQKSAGETFRQFAERVRHTASRASRVEGIYMDATQTRTWIAARSVKAFLKGIPGQYAGFFVNNPPASLEEAMKKAEQLEDALEPREADRWNVARIQVQDKRCFRCRELGHIASGCPNIPRPPTPPPQRRNAMGSPQKPCSYCGSNVHFPAHYHSGLDLLGLDLLRRIPASIHLDSCEVRMTHPQTGQSVVISDVITGYLSPARPVPMPNREQPMRPRIAVVEGSHAFDTAHLLDPVDMEVSSSDDCPILDPSEEFPTEDLDEPIPDLLGVLQQQLQHLPTTDANYVVHLSRLKPAFERGVPDDACITPPIKPMPDQRPEPVPCSWEMDDLIFEDDDVYPVARFTEVQAPAESMETAPVEIPAENPKILKTENAAENTNSRQLRSLPRQDYRQLHSGKPSKQPKT
ncbi:hypothetical protein GE061_005891 [Apolygus lucorum]|uniref:Regulatory protein zeste n=1 Tax=Apolygus lucorum TaxID=248454 RepID=A0A8S9WXH0_APOLU|nr:hypothetical protein GE061_005891 [Apolygus lucorum]